MNRLLDGKMSALHTLLTIESCAVDPVAVLLGSSVGLGMLAVCLQVQLRSCIQPASPAPKCKFTIALATVGVSQPARLGIEFGGVHARYAAALLVRVLVSPNGALVAKEHAIWLKQIVKALQAAGSRDDELVAALGAAERALQPSLFLREYGPEALANNIESLLRSGANEALSAFDGMDGAIEPSGGFSLKAMGAGGERLAERLREITISSVDTLVPSLQALRSAAVRAEVTRIAALIWFALPASGLR